MHHDLSLTQDNNTTAPASSAGVAEYPPVSLFSTFHSGDMDVAFPTLTPSVISIRHTVVKRSIDLIASLALSLLVGLPALAIALLIKASSRGPVFYREERIGQYGSTFKIWKFRTMYTTEELRERQIAQLGEEAAASLRMHLKHTGDLRITPLGRFLRRWSLDEIPQLMNVIAGDMSMVGPRPIVQRECDLFDQRLIYYLLVRPGLSGLWQISGRSDLSYAARVQLDCEYVQHWSLIRDFAILLKTFPAVLSKRGAY